MPIHFTPWVTDLEPSPSSNPEFLWNREHYLQSYKVLWIRLSLKQNIWLLGCHQEQLFKGQGLREEISNTGVLPAEGYPQWGSSTDFVTITSLSLEARLLGSPQGWSQPVVKLVGQLASLDQWGIWTNTGIDQARIKHECFHLYITCEQSGEKPCWNFSTELQWRKPPCTFLGLLRRLVRWPPSASILDCPAPRRGWVHSLFWHRHLAAKCMPCLAIFWQRFSAIG